MNLPTKLIKDFATMANNSSVEEKPITQLYGTVKVVEDKKYVILDGSNSLTPISEIVDVETDDRVLVSIENHKATIIGNFTFPPSARKTEDALEKSESAESAAQEAVEKSESAETAAQEAKEQVEADAEKITAAQEAAAEASTKANEANSLAQEASTKASEVYTLADEAKTAAQSAESKAAEAMTNVGTANTEIAAIRAEVDAVNADVDGFRADFKNQIKTEVETLSVNYATKTDLTTIEGNFTAEISKSAAEIQATLTESYVAKSDNVALEERLQSQITQNAGLISSSVKSIEKLETDTTEAQKAIDAAQKNANDAITAANDAQAKATAAQTAATDAKSKADAADKALKDAQDDLAEAEKNLESVSSRVDATDEEVAAAKAAVAAAQTAVNKAQADATAAATAASNAQTAANNAETKAQEAKNAADKAQEDLNKLATRVTAAETKIEQTSEQISLVANRTTTVENKFANYSTTEQMNAAIKLKADSITSTVESVKTTANGAASTAEAAETTATQTANKFSWIVSSGSSASDFTITDRMATLTAEKINLKGLVTFGGLNKEAQDAINKAIDDAADAKDDAASAATSASNAASSASSASTSASNAASSASSASTSASNAAKDAKSASTSASSAATSASNAESSASTAATKATNAATSASNAESSASTASTKATNAATDAKNAANSASSAATSASNAASDAKSAASSASSAASSASSAASKIAAWCYANNETYIDGANIYTGTITAGKIAAGAITAAKIAANTITSAEIATGAITADEIAANAVTTAKIAAGAITAAKIAANTITSAEIATGAITADEIAANAVTTAKIAARAITAAKISVDSLQAISASIGGFTIGSTYIANNTTSLAGKTNSVYLGTDGISCGTTFKVTKAGAITATSGKIGGFTISDGSLVSSASESACIEITFAGPSGYSSYTGNLTLGTSISGGVSFYSKSYDSANKKWLSVSMGNAEYGIEVCNESATDESLLIDYDGIRRGTSTQNLYFSNNLHIYDGKHIRFDSSVSQVGTNTYPSGDHVLANACYVHCKNTSGTSTRVVGLSSNNNVLLGTSTGDCDGVFIISGYQKKIAIQQANSAKTDAVDIFYFTYHSSLTKMVVYDKLTINNTTSTTDPNMVIGSTGIYYKYVSSSQRYKDAISEKLSDHLNPDKLYNLPVVEYIYKEGYLSENDIRYKQKFIGFIAESVEEIYPLAVNYNEDGTVEGWNAKVMLPAMLKLIQDQHKTDIQIIKRLDSTTERIEALQNQLNEAMLQVASLQKEIDILKAA